MKKIYILIFLGIFSISCFGQLNEFLIACYSADYNNKTYVPAGTDPVVGNDIELLKLYKKLGVNCVLIDYQLFWPETHAINAPSKYFLDNASSLGLKIILSSPDWNYMNRDNPVYNQANSIEALNYFGNHPSMIGISIADEPSTKHFPFIKNFSDDIRNYNNSLLRLSNMFPNIASNDQLFGTSGWPSYDDYDRYIQEYIESTNPNILSFDNYPISSKTKIFFLNLDVFAKKSIIYNIPYIYVLTNLKDPISSDCSIQAIENNIAEFNFQIYASLLYGAKGINYWHSQCKNDFVGSLSSDIIDYLSDLHSKLRKSSKTLMQLNFKSVYHKTSISTIASGGVDLIHSSSNWTLFANDNYAKDIFDVNNPIQAQSGSSTDNIAISFSTDNANNTYFWIFNKNITDAEYIQMNFKENMALIDVLDDKIYDENLSKVVYLEPGEAKLFKTSKNFQSTTTICNKTYSAGNYSDIWAQYVNIGGSSCNVIYMNGANINYNSEKISIREGVKIQQGSKVSFKGATMSYGTLKNESTENEVLNSSDLDMSTDLTIYPNPTTGQFTISTNEKDYLIYSYEIYNDLGMKTSEQYEINASEVTVTQELESGIYFININTSDGYKNEKIIIK